MKKTELKRKRFAGYFQGKRCGHRRWFRKAYVCKPVYVCRPEPVYYGCAPKHNVCCFPSW